jgi:hypothetical protein
MKSSPLPLVMTSLPLPATIVLFSVVVDEMDMTGFDTSFTGAIEAGVVTGVVFAATGQIVVYRALVSVVTEPIFAGQFVTVSGQAVIV